MKKVILLSAFLLVYGTAFAEKETMIPEQQQKVFQHQMQMMTPLFGQMMKTIMEAQLEILSQPDTAEKLATYTRNYYDALVKKGFSKDEALKITMTVGFPAFPSTQK
jgi:uncharacterized GH25 family protein